MVTAFPPEPNGYLHIGHAKSICLNFGLAEQFGGRCNLRFDDTNPEKEDDEYVQAIIEDVRWLGFNWEWRARFASDYFGQLYTWAKQLVTDGKAYICELMLSRCASIAAHSPRWAKIALSRTPCSGESRVAGTDENWRHR